MRLDDICIRCGVTRSSDFLLTDEELHKHGMRSGSNCFPIYTACLKGKKKVVKGSERNASKARVEKVNKASKGN